MGKNKDPPPFSLEKPYTQWKSEIKAWLHTVDTVDKNKNALTIALTMPEKGCNNIRQRIFNSVKLFDPPAEEAAEETISKTAWKELMVFLDKEFAKDDIAELYDKSNQFLHTQKNENEAVKEYINRFEDALNQATKAGIGDISQGFKMTLFLRNARLEDRDFKFVLSAIDYAKKDELYPQAKDSMIKFFGSIKSSQESDRSGGAAGGIIDCTETMWNSRGSGGFRGGFRGRGRGGNGGRDQEYSVKSRHAGNIFGQPPQNKTFRKLNPKKFGKHLACHNCQAITHLANECPEANITLIGETEDLIQLMEFNRIDDPASENKDYVEDISQTLQNAGQISDAVYAECWTVTATNTIYEDCMAVTVAKSEDVLQVKETEKKKEENNEAVLDTGCASSVCGRNPMNVRLRRMKPEIRALVKVAPSSKIFRFGGGETAKSLGLYTIPVAVGEKNTYLNVDVVDAPIPLLISKASMKTAGVMIDTRDDSITIFGQKLKLHEVPAGHYAMTLNEFDIGNQSMVEMLFTDEENQESRKVEMPDMWDNDKEKREKQIRKIHDQMGHPSIQVFKKMIQTSALFNKETDNYINKLYEDCITCMKFGKGKTRPKICAPLSQEVNSTIAMDLKIWPRFNTIILYITCVFSRYTMGIVIPDKKPESVIKAFMDNWVLGFFGQPAQILVDNGGEFNNESFKNMCEKLNIKLKTTGALSPWQNGIVERNHSIVDRMMEKMKEQNPRTPIKDLLKSAIFAKNTMVNKSGFSSSQIVTGSNPRIPGIPYNDPPANEFKTESEAVREKLTTMFKSRQEYMKMENDARLKKALNARSPPPRLEHYENGEEVFYRHGKDGIWHGPASVIGQANKVIYLKQGRFILAASQTNVKKKYPSQERKEEKKEGRRLRKEREEKERKDKNDQDSDKNNQDSDDDSSDESEEEEDNGHQNQSQSDNDNEADGNESTLPQPASPDSVQTSPARHEPDPAEPGISPIRETGHEAARDRSPASETRTASQPESPASNDAELREDSNEPEYLNLTPPLDREPEAPTPFVFDEMPRPKLVKNSEIWARRKSDRNKPEAWEKMKTIVRTHKRCKYGDTKHYGPHWNVVDESGNEIGWYEDVWDYYFDGHTKMDAVINYIDQYGEENNEEEEQEHQMEVMTYMVKIPREDWDKPFVLEAKKKELDNFKQYKAYEEVKDRGQSYITASWVITEKIYGNGEKGCKARLVCNGNQLTETVPSDSPTVRKNTLRTMTALCVQYGWKMYNCDVTAAFLQSEYMKREVYVKPPKDVAPKGTLWRLLVPMYGLPEAGLCWFLTVNKDLKGRGMKEVTLDPAAYFWNPSGNNLKGLYLGHVDDGYYCGDKDFHKDIMAPFFQKYKMGQIMEGEFKSLGWNVRTNTSGEIGISQKDYILSKLEKLDIRKERGQLLHDRLTTEQASQLRSKIGTLRWLADQTRPDVAINCLVLNTRQLDPTWKDVKLFNATVDKVIRQPVEIIYRKLEPNKWFVSGISPDLVEMEVYCDSKNAMSICEVSTPTKSSIPIRNERQLIKQFLNDGKIEELKWVREIELLETLNREVLSSRGRGRGRRGDGEQCECQDVPHKKQKTCQIGNSHEVF